MFHRIFLLETDWGASKVQSFVKGNLWLKSMHQQDKRCNNMTAVIKAFQKNDPLFLNHVPGNESFKCNMASTRGRADETL